MADSPYREILQGFQNAYETYGGSLFCLLALFELEKFEDEKLFKERWGCLGSIYVHEHEYEDIEELWIYGSLCEDPLRKQFVLQDEPYKRFKELAAKAGARIPLHIRKKIIHDIIPQDAVEWWLSFLWYHNTPNKDDYILPLGEYSTVNVLIHRTNWKHPFLDSITAIEEGGLVNEEPQPEQDVKIHPIENSTKNQDEPRISSTQEAFKKDFSDFTWNGTRYTFTKMQAKAVSEWYDAYMKGNPELRDETVLAEIGSQADDISRALRGIFKDHPAWGTMIITGSRRGTHRLTDPPKK